MSTWQDLIDDSSVLRFVEGGSQNNSTTQQQPSSSSADHLAETELVEPDVEEDSEGGITILSSVPSSQSGLPTEPSIKTTQDSIFDDASVPLSLNPSSVASSVISDFSVGESVSLLSSIQTADTHEELEERLRLLYVQVDTTMSFDEFKTAAVQVLAVKPHKSKTDDDDDKLLRRYMQREEAFYNERRAKKALWWQLIVGSLTLAGMLFLRKTGR